jgi:hypothetical protein
MAMNIQAETLDNDVYQDQAFYEDLKDTNRNFKTSSVHESDTEDPTSKSRSKRATQRSKIPSTIRHIAADTASNQSNTKPSGSLVPNLKFGSTNTM